MTTLYLLCGLPGTGKTVFARQLEKEGRRRFSLDEESLLRLSEYRDPHNDLRVSRELLDDAIAKTEEELSTAAEN